MNLLRVYAESKLKGFVEDVLTLFKKDKSIVCEGFGCFFWSNSSPNKKGVLVLIFLSKSSSSKNIMENLPPPNNDLNIPKNEHAPTLEHAPIAPNLAPIQLNGYLNNDEESEEEDEPIPKQAPAEFAPQFIGWHDLNNNNGWIEDEDEDEVVDNKEEEEDGVNDNEDEAEVIIEYKEVDPLIRPPPTSDEETEFAPPVVPITDFNDEPIPLVIQFGQNFHVGESLSAGALLEGNIKVRTSSFIGCNLEGVRMVVIRLDKQMLNRPGSGEIPVELRFVEESPIYTVSTPPADDAYAMVRDADMAAREDDDDDITAPRDPQPSEPCGSPMQDGVEATIRAGGPAGGPTAVPVAQECTFTGYMKCGPCNFIRLKWNTQVATLGLEVANGKPWTEVKKMMINEFCPIEEVQRLEDELRHLKLRDVNIDAYTERFNELALLCHDVVPNERKVELYIKGLPKIQANNERIAESNKRRWENNNQGGNNNRNNNDNHNNNKNNHNNHGNYHDNNRHDKYNQRKQDGARARIAAQNNVVDHGGPTPKCNRYGLCPFGNCLTKCTKCNKMGHKVKDCRVRGVATRVNTLPIRACYECEEQNQDRSQCLKLVDQSGGNATGRAYALRDAKHGQGTNVVNGMFLLNNHYVRVLFDSGLNKSFVNSRFSHLIHIKMVRLNISYSVELADGKLVITNTVLRGCTLNLLNQLFKVDLMPTEIGTFDVIIGMDWFVKHDALIVYEMKEVHIPVKGFPPPRQVDFRIELMPEAAPITRAPYCLTSSKLKELSNQLKELSEKGFI
nr:hypothetical protein [Tanacetum cinerariifolium]